MAFSTIQAIYMKERLIRCFEAEPMAPLVETKEDKISGLAFLCATRSHLPSLFMTPNSQ
ncbi:hypothetical protein P691DRAFT_548961 [Macrolepiota fuliginosa MF-IS2]|uniref:Uncharacterized protein n=1 Tax=Macrolepiota fuliginosa MF-IS2 TaxID=1400762 RepID=A0A9P6BXN9_9AGAR|nr:hypothetical protein P691DRAFT_548961 [Macrolepiota fuliginosa MF-IS2]